MDRVTTADIEVEVRVNFDADGMPHWNLTISGDRDDRIKNGDLEGAVIAIVDAVERRIDKPPSDRVTTADIEVEVKVNFYADGMSHSDITVSGDRDDRIKNGDLEGAVIAIVDAIERRIDKPQSGGGGDNGQGQVQDNTGQSPQRP